MYFTPKKIFSLFLFFAFMFFIYPNDKISDEDKETIKKAVEEAKEVLKDTNAEASKYEEAAKELANKVMPIGAKLYQANSTDQTNPEAGKTNQDEPVEGEVVDK